jgi:cytochrome P450
MGNVETVESLMRSGPMAPIEDPYSVYAELRRSDPVKRVDTVFSKGYFVSRFEDVHTVLKHDEIYSSRSNGERGIALVMGRTIVGMDGREHLRHRALITPALAPRALRGDFPSLVRDIAHGIIDDFAAAGAADLVSAFTFAYPLRVFVERRSTAGPSTCATSPRTPPGDWPRRRRCRTTWRPWSSAGVRDRPTTSSAGSSSRRSTARGSPTRRSSASCACS